MQLADIKTIEDLESYRKSLNESCDKKADSIRLTEKLDEIRNKPFGYLKNCMESIAPTLFTTKDGKRFMKRYADTIRSNKNLSALHTIYESIRKADACTDVDFFIGALSKTNKAIDTKNVDSDVRELGNIVAESVGYLNGAVEIPQGDEKLDKAVEYIAENTVSMANLNEYSSAVKVIREHISAKKPSERNDMESGNDLYAATDDFNRKYSNALSESEIQTLSVLGSTSDRRKLFEDKKSECIGILNEAMGEFNSNGDTASVTRIGSIISQIQNKRYSTESIVTDLTNMREISKLFTKE